MAGDEASSDDRRRAAGRRAGIAIYTLIVVTFTGAAALQVSLQVWSPELVPTDVGCRPGLTGLVEAVQRARGAAASHHGGEREALGQFRAALAPEWDIRASLTVVCAGDSTALAALKLIDRLRYAEEHAVRYEAEDVALLRRRVHGLDALVARRQDTH